MTAARIQQGELAYWLGILAAAREPRAGAAAESSQDMPSHIAEALQILRCIEVADGGFRLTDKGRLALRMADPAAIHLQ